MNLRHAGGRVDPTHWPRFAAFIDRMHAGPGFAACIDDESRILKPGDWEL